MDAPTYSVEKTICKVLGIDFRFVTKMHLSVSADRQETTVTVAMRWTDEMRKQAEELLAQKDSD